MPVRVNDCPNPSLKVDDTGCYDGARTTVTGLPSPDGVTRDQAYRVTLATSTSVVLPAVECDSGEHWNHSLYARANDGDGTIRLYQQSFTDDTYLGSGTAPARELPSGVWTRVSWATMALNGANEMRALAVCGGPATTVDIALMLWEGDPSLDYVDIPPGGYFDGDSPDAAWDDTDGLSSSTLTVEETDPTAGPSGTWHATAAQTIPDATETAVAFPTANYPTTKVTQVGDDTFEFDEAGTYTVSAGVRFEAPAGTGFRGIAIGNQLATTETGAERWKSHGADHRDGPVDATASTTRRFQAGDRLCVWAYQDTGGGLDTVPTVDDATGYVSLDIALVSAASLAASTPPTFTSTTGTELLSNGIGGGPLSPNPALASDSTGWTVSSDTVGVLRVPVTDHVQATHALHVSWAAGQEEFTVQLPDVTFDDTFLAGLDGDVHAVGVGVDFQLGDGAQVPGSVRLTVQVLDAGENELGTVAVAGSPGVGWAPLLLSEVTAGLPQSDPFILRATIQPLAVGVVGDTTPAGVMRVTQAQAFIVRVDDATEPQGGSATISGQLSPNPILATDATGWTADGDPNTPTTARVAVSDHEAADWALEVTPAGDDDTITVTMPTVEVADPADFGRARVSVDFSGATAQSFTARCWTDETTPVLVSVTSGTIGDPDEAGWATARTTFPLRTPDVDYTIETELVVVGTTTTFLVTQNQAWAVE